MDILKTLSLSPTDTLTMPANLRSRLINFLIRWEHSDAALVCLDALQQDRPDLVSLYDARVRALLALERADEALQAMVTRHKRKQSFTSRTQLARIYLACDQSDTALDLAKELVSERPDSVLGWGLLGDVHLALGDLDAAEGAYRRIDDVRPNSRFHAYRLARFYRAQADYVSASAWAVRLESYADPETPLRVYQLRWLRDYYDESGEANRVADIDAQLDQRYQTELAELQEALFEMLGVGEGPQGSKEPKGTKGPDEPEVMPPSDSSGSFGSSAPSIEVTAEELKQLQDAAKHYFGFDDLLPGQAEVMALMLRGESALAVLPTGGGKSLCYQLPALLTEGATFVVSPLIALMKDQVDGLPPEIRRQATTINSTLGGDELRRRLQRAADGHYRLIYAAPERLRQPPFLHALQRANIARFVIDEAHCVSMWGHDFRPDYFFLREACRRLGNPPILAMTATAPTRVRRDIMRRLGDMELVATDIHRPNLRLESIPTPNNDAKLGHLIRLSREIEGAGIVYAHTQAKCEELAAMLRLQGIAAEHYHAGIDDRSAAQDRFMQGEVRIVVATVAFGMGIDKPDIRFIIHFNLPRSLEAYYQEAGRAGRDGLPSRCILFYSPSDRGRLTRWARDDQIELDFLRRVYSAVTRWLNGADVGRVAIGDLMRDVQAGDTAIRVALSLLEEVDLLRRHFNAPRTTILTRRTAEAEDGAFARFVEAARLVPHQPVERNIIDVARSADFDPIDVEYHILRWQDRGWIECRSAGRDLLVERLTLPADARERIDRLLDTYAAVQDQRIDEVAAYAKTRRCRHGHISAYFGGRPIDDCGACDNCLGARTPGIPERKVDEHQEFEAVLRCVDSFDWSYGRRNLSLILKGSPQAPAGAEKCSQYGALSHRSTTVIGRRIDRLVEAGFLRTRELDHGGVVVEITDAGRQAIADPQKLDPLVSPSPSADRRPEKSEQASDYAEVDDYDEALFERLRAWRLKVAKEAGVAPFIVAHNAVLQRIADQKPQTRDELADIYGIGPKKLAGYGTAILEVVRDYLAET